MPGTCGPGSAGSRTRRAFGFLLGLMPTAVTGRRSPGGAPAPTKSSISSIGMPLHGSVRQAEAAPAAGGGRTDRAQECWEQFKSKAGTN